MRRSLLLLLMLASSATAQTDSTATSAATLIVEATSGVVLVDGETEGTPGQFVDVAPGDRQVRLVEALGMWNPRTDSARVTLAAGDTLRLAMALPVRTRVETEPAGAEITLVSADGSVRALGSSPVTVDLPEGTMAEWVAEADGYAPMRRAVGSEPVVQMTLIPRPGVRVPPEVQTFETRRASRRRTLIDLGIGAATLTAGAVAVYYKFEADAVDDQYRDPESPRRGDETLRQEALSLDRRSAIALGAMQAGVGVLVLRFVLR